MLSSWINVPEDRPLRVLCLGAHCDDVEIGCGGTLLKLVREQPGVEVTVRIMTRTDAREAESRAALDQLLAGAGRYEVGFEDFRNSYFPSCMEEIKDHIDGLKSLQPDLIFTHYRDDHHQDHRVVSELTRNSFRDHMILEYEILKYDGDLGNPPLFVPLDAITLERKCEILASCFPSQASRQWFSSDTFAGLARIRGVQGACVFAEAFYAPKLLFGPPA